MTTPARNFSIAQWYTFWLGVLIFLIPSNLFLKFFESSAYVHGLLVDYLLPKLYLSDLVIFILLGTWLVQRVINRKKFDFSVLKKNSNALLIFFTLLLLIFCRQFFTPKPFAAIWLFLKYVEMGLLAAFLLNHKELFSQRWIKICFLTMVIFQSLLAIFQFWKQSSFFPSYLFLGETRLTQGGGIATGIFNGVEKILPYGTTAHPNILGGILAVGVFLVLKTRDKNHGAFVWLMLGPMTIALFLTQSISAWLILGISLLLVTRIGKKVVEKHKNRLLAGVAAASVIVIPATLALAKIFTENVFIYRRLVLIIASFNMAVESIIWGVGLNNFTVQLENFAPLMEVVRFVQPVHHTGLLWLAEMGLVGVGMTLSGTLLLKKKAPNLFKAVSIATVLLLPALVFDHYLLTTQTGLLVAVFSIYGVKRVDL